MRQNQGNYTLPDTIIIKTITVIIYLAVYYTVKIFRAKILIHVYIPFDDFPEL